MDAPQGLAARGAVEGLQAQGVLAQGEGALVAQVAVAEAGEVGGLGVVGPVDEPQVLLTTHLQAGLREALPGAGQVRGRLDHHPLSAGAGLDRHAREQAQRYAELGYAVLACDMYGDGVAGDRERVMACLVALRDDPAFLVRRGQAGLTALSRCPEAGGSFAAIGFCFGGMAALALARSGADLAGVVSIHGSLATSKPAEPDAVVAKVLVCHGASDPHIPMADVTAFTDEMAHADADWQLVVYGRAMHGFTHKHAVAGAMPGVAFDPLADERSFAATRAFLAEALAP